MKPWKVRLPLFFLFFSLLSLSSFFNLRLFHSQPATLAPTITLLPPKSLKAFSFGFSNLLADAYFIWTIQAFGIPGKTPAFSDLETVMTVIGELDPSEPGPFSVGSLIAYYQGGRPDLALKVLEIGMRLQPGEWTLPYEAGHYMRKAKRYSLASRLFEIAAHKEGAPSFIKRLQVDALKSSGDSRNAFLLWQEILHGATTDYEREVAGRHLYELKTELDREELEPLVEHYRRLFNRLPQSWNDMIAASLLPSPPLDYDGEPYILTQEGKIQSRKRFSWKR
ncbi:MAG TPA: hypothetical protein PLB68_05350 [Candidatus Aminicenantes bacterium]|nr:hypothetical protein [Candidatus Aminicenantes bacterium]HPB55366.1 hypothetical protein [Candidatus Aminicenantes bacterium]HPT00133.1 hypothetical protein [Candidatus Aminicenantes bacterium]